MYYILCYATLCYTFFPSQRVAHSLCLFPTRGQRHMTIEVDHLHCDPMNQIYSGIIAREITCMFSVSFKYSIAVEMD